MSNSGEGRWITVNGTHIFIKNGQSVGEALSAVKGKASKSSGAKKTKSASEVVADAKQMKSKGKKEKTGSLVDDDFKKTGYYNEKQADTMNKAFDEGKISATNLSGLITNRMKSLSGLAGAKYDDAWDDNGSSESLAVSFNLRKGVDLKGANERLYSGLKKTYKGHNDFKVWKGEDGIYVERKGYSNYVKMKVRKEGKGFMLDGDYIRG